MGGGPANPILHYVPATKYLFTYKVHYRVRIPVRSVDHSILSPSML